jgi:hypothetical protein
MAKNKISEFSSTAADNTDITNINIAEGCSPANVNNAIRSLMSVLKNFEDGSSGDNVVVGGNLRVDGTTTLVGTAIAPTPTASDDSTKIATTAFVKSAADTARTYSTLQTFKNNAFEVVDNSDTTKKVALSVSGVTTETTRTLTVPDKNGTIATTLDLPATLSAANNTVVSGTYAATSSSTITITATNTFTAGQTVFIQFTNTSGSSLTNNNFSIVTATGSSFTINYGSSVTSAGTCIATRYGIIALATATDLSNRTDTLRAVTPSSLTISSGTSQTTTSGTSIDFTGIPSWVKRITVMFSGVSTNGSSTVIIQIGNGSVEITNYTGTGAGVTGSNVTSGGGGVTSGFAIDSNAQASASATRNGIATIALLTGSTYAFNSVVTGNSYVSMFGYSKTTSAVIDRIRITTVNGTDTFDAGSINILYE